MTLIRYRQLLVRLPVMFHAPRLTSTISVYLSAQAHFGFRFLALRGCLVGTRFTMRRIAKILFFPHRIIGNSQAATRYWWCRLRL
jgi:hypothetical protein